MATARIRSGGHWQKGRRWEPNHSGKSIISPTLEVNPLFKLHYPIVTTPRVLHHGKIDPLRHSRPLGPA